MFVSKSLDVFLVRTPFKQGYDLVQKFRGCNNQSLSYNAPIDFVGYKKFSLQNAKRIFTF